VPLQNGEFGWWPVNLDKISVFEEGLNDPTVEVHLHRVPGLLAPEFLVYPTMFEYGLNMPNPIADLLYDNVGIRATLSFNQKPYITFVPWKAVWAICLPHRGVLVQWKNDFPPDPNDPNPTPSDKPTESVAKKPFLKIV
jgi:hypothetical protein